MKEPRLTRALPGSCLGQKTAAGNGDRGPIQAVAMPYPQKTLGAFARLIGSGARCAREAASLRAEPFLSAAAAGGLGRALRVAEALATIAKTTSRVATMALYGKIMGKQQGREHAAGPYDHR